MLAPVNHILPITMVQRTRMLPVPGEVLAIAGQEVGPRDLVATAYDRPRHYMLNVARGLGVSEESASRLIERREGDSVVEGDIIATRSGFGSRTIRARQPGKIVLISGGQVLIQADTPPYQLLAGYPGMIVELIPNRGAVIETTGALLRAIWGNGKLDSGVLTVLSLEPDFVLSPEHIDASARGGVILAGRCAQEKTLRNAAEQRIHGMILGSLAPELAATAVRMPYPIVVLEGFGRRPLNSAAFKLLSTNDKRDVTVNAEAFDRRSGSRPEILIPLPGLDSLDTPSDMGLLEPGVRVRIIREPYRGQVADVLAVPVGKIAFSNGLRAPGANLELENGETVQAPLANLEILK